MCTVSIVPVAGGFRVMCNRDELRSRPPASAPVVYRGATTTSIWPVDPVSGGTWIGVNDAGLALVLLNRKDGGGCVPASPSESRGTVIPRLLEKSTVESVIDAALRSIPSRLAPHTLVALQHTRAVSITIAGSRPVVRWHDLSRPHLFTSSSLGDDLATLWRSPLFARLVEHSGNAPRGQAAFHYHRWTALPEISVRMARADATTVSVTTVEVRSDRIQMHYDALEGES